MSYPTRDLHTPTRDLHTPNRDLRRAWPILRLLITPRSPLDHPLSIPLRRVPNRKIVRKSVASHGRGEQVTGGVGTTFAGSLLENEFFWCWLARGAARGAACWPAEKKSQKQKILYPPVRGRKNGKPVLAPPQKIFCSRAQWGVSTIGGVERR